MTWIQHALHERRMKVKKKKNSQHVVQSFSTEVVRLCKGAFLQRLLPKIAFYGPSMHMCTCALFSTLDTVFII